MQCVYGGTEVVAGPERGNLEQPTDSSRRWGIINAVGASCHHRSPVSSGRTRFWPVEVGHRSGEVGHLCGPTSLSSPHCLMQLCGLQGQIRMTR